ncbi:MAG: hypothetical protein ACFFEY_00970 [Candidatus Thorarchaeota archaeon]
MAYSLPNELIQTKKLIIEGNHEVALNLLKSFEERGVDILQDSLRCRLLKCELLFQQGLYEDLLNLAEKGYKDSLELGINFLSFDLLMWKARALVYLFRLENLFNIITLGEQFLEKLIQESPTDYKQQKATIAFVKGLFYFWEKRDTNLALWQLNHSLALRKKFGSKPEIVLTNIQIAKVLIYGKGELYSADTYLERGMTIAKEINYKYAIAWGLLIMAVYLGFNKNIDQCIKSNEQSLVLFKELNNRYMVANVLNNIGDTYRLKGDLDRALKFIKERFSLCFDSGSKREIAVCYDPLIQIYLQKGDIEKAQIYLDNMEKLVIDLKDKQINRWYLFDKALILKKSLRARKRARAEEILTQIIEEEDSDYELIVIALINLCDLLLSELEITDEVEILDEIRPLISHLLIMAEKSHSYWIWGETFLLNAKLALFSLNLKEARRYLTQGQKIAEKYGLEFLAMKISNEHDTLLKQLNKWENLREADISLSERMKLTRLNEQMEQMVRGRIPKVLEPSDEEPVFFLIVSEGGIPFFSYSFIEDKTFEDHLFGGFFTAINSFIHEKFSEGLDRASFGKYTLLMSSISPFLMFYIYQGQSYSAQKRIKTFIDKLQSKKEIWDTFEKFYQTNMKIQISDIPSLETLLKEIFVEKTIH